jgi:hypothetical protein
LTNISTKKLYNDAFLINEKISRKRERQKSRIKQRANGRMVDEESEKMVEEREDKLIAQLFDDLDNDKDGLISPQRIDISFLEN